MIERSLDQEQANRKGTPEGGRPCFFCLEGWVFLGSVGHDGEEIIESIRCRQCEGSGTLYQRHK